MSERPVVFLQPLTRFVLEVLPWALSGLIGLYLLWGFWSGPEAGRAGLGHVAEQAAAAPAVAATPLDAAPLAGPRLASAPVQPRHSM